MRYAEIIEADPKLQFKTYLSHETVQQGSSKGERYEFVSNLGNNYYYLLDPVYSQSTGKLIFKFGRADGALDGYRVMSHQNSEKSAQLLHNKWISNKNILMSPQGGYVAFITGGTYDGPDYAYFPTPVQLWIASTTSSKAWRVASGDSLNNAYGWNDENTLVYASSIKGEGLFVSAYDVEQSTSKPITTLPASAWRNQPFIQDLVRVAAVAGVKIEKPDILKELKQPFAYKDYQVGSLYLAKSKQAIFFLTYATPKSEIDDANRRKDGIIKQRYDIWGYDLTGQIFIKSGEFEVEDYLYLPTVKILTFSRDGFYILAKTFVNQRSPVTKDKEIVLPQKVFSILRVNKKGTSILWRKQGLAGLSVSYNGEPPVLLPY